MLAISFHCVSCTNFDTSCKPSQNKSPTWPFYMGLIQRSAWLLQGPNHNPSAHSRHWRPRVHVVSGPRKQFCRGDSFFPLKVGDIKSRDSQANPQHQMAPVNGRPWRRHVSDEGEGKGEGSHSFSGRWNECLSAASWNNNICLVGRLIHRLGLCGLI